MKHEQSKTWRYFEQNALTHSAAHYLMTIKELKEENGYARLSDIADHMDVSAGSCSTTLGKLKEKGYIYDDEKKMYHLTDFGNELIDAVIKNEVLFQKFFHQTLGVDLWEAEVNACKIEHLISPDIATALCQFLHFLESDTPIAQTYMKAFREYQEKNKTQCADCDRENPSCQLNTKNDP